MIKFAAREQFVAPDNKKKQSREEFGHAAGSTTAPQELLKLHKNHEEMFMKTQV